MEEIIQLLNKTITDDNSSLEKNRSFELLIKARTINILKPQAENGVGFAIEAISRIAASDSSMPSAIQSTEKDFHE